MCVCVCVVCVWCGCVCVCVVCVCVGCVCVSGTLPDHEFLVGERLWQ